MSPGDTAIGSQVLSRPGRPDSAAAFLVSARPVMTEAVAASPARPWDERIPPPGRDATLLAVVPVPGTQTSLAVVGYAISTSGVPVHAPAPAEPSVRRPAGSGLVVDHVQRRVRADGSEIALTFQEFELLAFLSAHPATVFCRADRLERAWQRGPAQGGPAQGGPAQSGPAQSGPARDRRSVARESRTIDVHVSRLRHKLGPLYGQCLVTEYRAGYQFRPLAS